MTAILDYFGSELMSKFLETFASSGLRVISCFSAPNMRIFCAKYDRISVADIEICPEFPEDKREWHWNYGN